MPSLKHIKNRIKGVTSTKKITQAMKIVSASSLKNAEDNIINSREHLHVIEKILVSAYYKDKELFNDVIQNYNNDSVTDTLLVTFSSDKGLCGAFNSRVINKVILEINKGIKILCVGNKISQYMSGHFEEYVEHYIPFFCTKSKKVNLKQSVNLVNKIEKLFNNRKFGKCKVIYTRFSSVMNHNIEVINLLPINICEIEKKLNMINSYNQVFEFDGDLGSILDKLVSKYLNAVIFNIYCHSLACEHSARMLAMENATQNSKKMLKDLNLLYNRSRQAIITKELIEIISGSEATK